MSTSPLSEDTFPTFSDGDVTIIVSSSHQYKLHSRILRQQSNFFLTEFDKITAPKLTAQARRDGFTPYRFVLIDVGPTLNEYSHRDDEENVDELNQKLVSIVSTKLHVLYLT